MPGMGGMPPMPGMGAGGKGKVKNAKGKKKGSRSGNPAKRAQENAAATTKQSVAGSAFGAPAQQEPDLKDLPKGFEKFLK